MHKLVAGFIALALSGSTAFAHSNFTAQEVSVKVRAAAAAKGIAVSRVHTRGLGFTASGTMRRALSVNENGTVTEWLISKKGAIRRNTKLVDQSTARGTANLVLRREHNTPGTFSGVNSSGLSSNGNSYRFNSATDRTEAVYVSVKTGEVTAKRN